MREKNMIEIWISIGGWSAIIGRLKINDFFTISIFEFQMASGVEDRNERLILIEISGQIFVNRSKLKHQKK